MGDDRAVIEELEERWVAAMNGSDINEFDDLLTEDAILMMPDRPAVVGRESIVSHQREFFRSIRAQMASVVAEIEIFSEICYSRGAFSYRMTPKMGGEGVPMRGKFINLFKRDEMKQWRFWRNIYNIDHPHDG